MAFYELVHTALSAAAILLSCAVNAYMQAPAINAPSRPFSSSQLYPRLLPIKNVYSSCAPLKGLLRVTAHAFHIKTKYDYELRDLNSKACLARLIMGEVSDVQLLTCLYWQKSASTVPGHEYYASFKPVLGC